MFDVLEYCDLRVPKAHFPRSKRETPIRAMPILQGFQVSTRFISIVNVQMMLGRKWASNIHANNAYMEAQHIG